MKLLTSGKLNPYPIKIDTSASLQRVIDGLKEQPYEAKVPTSGWGEVSLLEKDEAEALYKRNCTGRPTWHPQSFGAPLGLGRLFFDRFSSILSQQIPVEQEDELGAAATHVLDAIDVLFMETGQSLTALINTHTSHEISSRVMPKLRSVLEAIDPDHSIVDPHPEFSIDPDLFLWLLSQQETDGWLLPGLRLLEIRTVQGIDGIAQKARVLDSASLERLELQAMISNVHETFGPMKVALRDDDVRLEADIYLASDGSFSVHVGRSHYFDDIESRPQLGVHLVHDVARSTVPRLRRAYGEDQAWRKGGRTAFRDQIRTRLRQRLA